MDSASGSKLRNSITQNGPTAKDDAWADQEAELRRHLLARQEVRDRFADLAQLRPAGELAQWQPKAGLAYWLAVGRLSSDLEGSWTEAEIEEIARKWDTRRTVGVGFTVGRPRGRGRARREPTAVDLAARSLALRAAGLKPSQADARAADEVNTGVPPAYWTRPNDVAVYRKRLRDDRRADG